MSAPVKVFPLPPARPNNPDTDTDRHSYPPPLDGDSDSSSDEAGGDGVARLESRATDAQLCDGAPVFEYLVRKAGSLKLGALTALARYMTYDTCSNTLRFSDLRRRPRSEVPIGKISSVDCEEYANRQLVISFSERDRKYHLTFETAEECKTFHEQMMEALDAQQQLRLMGNMKGSTSSHMSMVSVSTGITDGSSIADDLDGLGDDASGPVHLQYSAFPVLKKNRFGIRQNRFLVLTGEKIQLLDPQRKFIKCFELNDIVSVECIPSTKEAEAFIVFQKIVQQRPFQIFFVDYLDRLHFVQTLRSSGRKIAINDDVDDMKDISGARFCVTKYVGARIPKRRVLYVRPEEGLIRTYDSIKDYKEIDVIKITRLDACQWNPLKVNIWFRDVIRYEFDFSDSNSRKRFMALVTQMIHVKQGQKVDLSRVSVYCGSWNVGGLGVPTKDQGEIPTWIPQFEHDIYAISFQECPGPRRQEWTEYLNKEYLSGCGNNYVLVSNKALWEIGVVVFARSDLLCHISNIETGSIACGIGDVLGNKGGAAVAMSVGNTMMCFVTCHLAARAERITQRRDNFLKIAKHLRFGNQEVDILSQFDHVFWFGDLNYRVELEFDKACQLTRTKEFEALLAADQLTREMREVHAVGVRVRAHCSRVRSA